MQKKKRVFMCTVNPSFSVHEDTKSHKPKADCSPSMIKIFILLEAFIFFTLAEPTPAQPLAMDDLNALMRLFADWYPKDPSWTYQTPACQWRGVMCFPSESVTGINVDSLHLNGTFNGTNLPSGVQSVILRNNTFSGIPILSGLPANLQHLDLGDNQFSGTPNLSGLPTGLVYLYLGYNNQFSGTPNLSGLPAGLQQLYLSQSSFSGTPNLSDLPTGLQYLCLDNNQFSGTPNLSNLPVGLQVLYLHGNQFSGTPNLSGLPTGLVYMDFSQNQFSGTPNFSGLPTGLQYLYTTFNQFCGSTPIDISCASVQVDGTCDGNGTVTFYSACTPAPTPVPPTKAPPTKTPLTPAPPTPAPKMVF